MLNQHFQRFVAGALDYPGMLTGIYLEMVNGSLEEFVRALEDPVRKDVEIMQNGYTSPGTKNIAEHQAAILVAMEKAGDTPTVIDFIVEESEKGNEWASRVKENLFSDAGPNPAWVGWRLC